MKKVLFLLLLSFFTNAHSMHILKEKKSNTWDQEKKERVQKAMDFIKDTKTSQETVQVSLQKISDASAIVLKHLNDTKSTKNDAYEKEFSSAITDLMHYTQVYRLQYGNSIIPPLPLPLSILISVEK